MASKECKRCGQLLSDTMQEQHSFYLCDLYKRYSKYCEANNMAAVVKTSVHMLEANDIPYKEFEIQAYRVNKEGDNIIKLYVTEKPAAVICNFFKGQCLKFLLWNYSVGGEFRDSVTFLSTTSTEHLLHFCHDTWIDDGMKPLDTNAIRKAIAYTVRTNPDRKLREVLDKRKISEGQDYEGYYAVTVEEIMGIVDTLSELRAAVYKVSHRKADAYIAGN